MMKFSPFSPRVQLGADQWDELPWTLESLAPPLELLLRSIPPEHTESSGQALLCDDREPPLLAAPHCKIVVGD